MKRIITLVLLFASVGYLNAQEITFPIRATLEAGSTKSFTFTVAADRLGSDSVDTDLGEVEIPSLPLPGDIFYVWTVAPLQEVIWLSPIDIRGFTVDQPVFHSYDLRVNWSGGRLTFSWTQPLPPGVDSMYIVDGFSDFPDNIQSVKVEPGSKLTTDNPAFDRFKVLVWYNVLTSSIDENEVNLSISIYPNPAAESITVSGCLDDNAYVQIVSQMGQTIRQLPLTQPSQIVNVSDLAAGSYLVNVVSRTGRKTVPFIRL